MKIRLTTCICCARQLPADTQFDWANGKQTPACIHCMALAPLDIMRTMQATVEGRLYAKYETAKGRKAARQEARLAAYADTGKRCTTCYTFKPVSEFGMLRSAPDGLQFECKACGKMRLNILRIDGGQALWKLTKQAMRDNAAATPSAPVAPIAREFADGPAIWTGRTWKRVDKPA